MGFLQESSERAFREELSTYAGQLLPGAAEELAASWSARSGVGDDPAKVANFVASRLGSAEYARYLDPERPDREGSVLRAAIMRHAGKLREGGVDALMAKLGLDYAHASPAAIAEAVRRELDSSENAGILKSAPPLTGREAGAARYERLMKAHFGYSDVAGLRAVAADLARLHPVTSTTGDEAIVRTIAGALTSKGYASGSGLEHVQTGDDRLHRRSVAEESEEKAKHDAQGRLFRPETPGSPQARTPLAG